MFLHGTLEIDKFHDSYTENSSCILQTIHAFVIDKLRVKYFAEYITSSPCSVSIPII